MLLVSSSAEVHPGAVTSPPFLVGLRPGRASITLACCVTLLASLSHCFATAASVTSSGRLGAAHDTIADPGSGQGTPWIQSGGVLSVPRGLSSMFLYNQSFFLVGGCLDPECRTKSSAITQYDPLEEDFLPTLATDIPLFFTIPSHSPKLPPTFVRATFAGPTAMIPVAYDVVKPQSYSNTYVRPWLVGPCALYYAFQGNSSEPEVQELYHNIWGLSLDLTIMEVFERVPSNVPFRANASCQAFGSMIFIIGGVDIDTLEPLNTIDAFDTVAMTYHVNVSLHVEAVMNPAVTVDNALLYVVGGQRAEGCNESSGSYLWTHRSRGRGDEVLHFCQSPRATAYYFPAGFFLNESIRLVELELPEVPSDVVEMQAGQGEGPPQLLRVASFGGTLTVSSQTSVTTSLSVEFLHVPSSSSTDTGSAATLAGRASPSSAVDVAASPFRSLLTPQWLTERVESLHIARSTMVMFPIPYVFFGVGLALFSFGGSYEDQQSTRPEMTDAVFQRFVGLSLPTIRGTPPQVEVINVPVNISLQPPMQGYLRLSDNSACYGNAVGTVDQFVNASVTTDGATSVSFEPTMPANTVYICFSFGVVDIGLNVSEVMFFTVINAFQPFKVLGHGTDIPIPSSGTGTSVRTILMSTMIPLCAVLFAAAGFVAVNRWRRGRTSGGGYTEIVDDDEDTGNVVGGRRGLLSDKLFHEDPKERMIRQTTSDSRYKVLKRIGEGAFSSVYLVCPKKEQSKTYAMKFMICADDRERLEAIKECETINTVQGHPSIIRLYDMFMNYEFGLNRGENFTILDESDQALLLTSSMHAIAIQRKSPQHQVPNAAAGGGGGGSTLSPKPPSPHATPSEKSPLAAVLSPPTVGTPGSVAYQKRNTIPSPPGDGHQQDVFPPPAVAPSKAVHTRYLCLVMEYHPAGDLCRYALRRAAQIADERNNAAGALAEARLARKKSSTTSEDDPKSGTSSSRSGSLKDVLALRHALSEPQLLSIAYQVASVLQFLHAQRPPIVHRDLKPENILIRGETPNASDPFIPIVVTDFGLAFIQEEHRRSGRGGGTRPYISPESWKGLTTTASDVWSFGCVLYALATERLTSDTVRVMFQDAKYPKFTHSILTDLIRTHRYSSEFAVFVASILEVDPKKRPTAEKLVKMFDVHPSWEAENEEGYITFKKDAFGPHGAAELVPFECSLLSSSGLPLSTESSPDQ